MSVSVVYLLVGVPASGKSTIAEQLKDRFTYVSHDNYIGGDYLGAITHAALAASHPVLCETPFGMNAMVTFLEARGLDVRPVYVIEEEAVLRDRWRYRDMVESTKKGHLTRQKTYLSRAALTGSYVGNGLQVLEYLKTLPLD